MNRVVFHLNYLMQSSVIVSVFSLFIMLTIINNWYPDGFDRLEISFMSILGGLIFFGVNLVFNTFFEIIYLKACSVENKTSVKMIFQIIYSSFYLILIALIFDALYYYLIDDSIAIEFADGLKNFMIDEGKSYDLKDLDDFRQMPFLLQNIFVLGFSCILSNIIALPSGRALFKMIYNKKEIGFQ